MLSRARARSCSSVQPDRATPTTGTSSCPRRAIACERREDLLVGEIAGGPEEDERVGARRRSCAGPLLDVAAELEAHRGEQPVLEVGLAARAKRSKSAAASTCAGTASSIAASSVQRPSPESDTRPAKRSSVGSRGERRRGQVEEPRGDDAAAPPDLGDRRRGRSRTGSTPDRGAASSRRPPSRARLPTFGVPQDVEALGVGGHEAVLDAVVHHLHEVPGAVRAAVQVALLGRAAARSRPGRRAAPRPRRARASRRAGRGAARPRPRRRSSGSSRARGPTRRRSCRSRRSGGRARRAASRASMSSR